MSRKKDPEYLARKLEDIRRWRQRNPGVDNLRERERISKIRKQVRDHYGETCVCCGSTENWTLDHINGDGRDHREIILPGYRNRTSTTFYRWVIKNGFPDYLQPMCRPCNASKQQGDRCRLDHSRTIQDTPD